MACYLAPTTLLPITIIAIDKGTSPPRDISTAHASRYVVFLFQILFFFSCCLFNNNPPPPPFLNLPPNIPPWISLPSVKTPQSSEYHRCAWVMPLPNAMEVSKSRDGVWGKNFFHNQKNNFFSSTPATPHSSHPHAHAACEAKPSQYRVSKDCSHVVLFFSKNQAHRFCDTAYQYLLISRCPTPAPTTLIIYSYPPITTHSSLISSLINPQRHYQTTQNQHLFFSFLQKFTTLLPTPQ